MKKILLLALAVAATVSCKRSTNIDSNPPVNEDQALIGLSVGSLSKAANIGQRDTLFKTGDQIGVIAAYAKEPSDAAPWWDSLYFSNKPACWKEIVDHNVAGTGDEDKYTLFAWGPAGEGGLTYDQFYPAKNKGIWLFAYYPYSADKLTYDATSKEPQLAVALVDGAVTDTKAVTEPNKAQSDVSYYAPSDSVHRTAQTKPLVFKHALAQVNFVVTKEEKAAACKFKSITFRTYKNGVMAVKDGAITLGALAVKADSAIYVITQGDQSQIPVTPKPAETPIVPILDTALMVFPMTVADAAKCYIELVVDADQTGIKPDLKKYKVDLKDIKAIKQGMLNILKLSISTTGITLEAKLKPWGVNTEENELPVE